MAILATEKVLTLDYWKPAAKLQVGDYVFNNLGKPVKITLVQEYRAQHCYEIQLDDNLTISGDTHLSFPTENKKYRVRVAEYRGIRKFRRPLRPVSIAQLTEESLRIKSNEHKYSIPTTKPIELPHQDLPVPPYVFGFWFINRRPSKNCHASGKHYEEVEQKFKDCGYKTVIVKKTTNGYIEFKIQPSIESQLAPNVPTQIPNNYLLGSVEQRIELLSGLIAARSRQYHDKEDTFKIRGLSFSVLARIQGLVESLSSKTRLVYRESTKKYTLFFRSRIKLLGRQEPPWIRVHHARRYITTITPIPSQSCIHIETDGADNTILVGEGFISCL